MSLGRALFARHRPALRLAEEALGYSLAQALDCEWLDRAPCAQAVGFALNALAYREWADAHGAAPDLAAGYGLGECNALHAAGAFDFQTGLRLAAERGRLMAAAGAGCMATVSGWSAQRLSEELAALDAGCGDAERGDAGRIDAGRIDIDRIDIAGYDAPLQHTVAGAIAPMVRAMQRLRERGARVVALRAGAAWHSQHMRGAAAAFAHTLATVRFAPTAFAVVSNLRARPYPRGREAQVLAAQIAAPVRWTDSIAYLLDAGVDRFEAPAAAPALSAGIEQFRAARPTSRARGEARFDAAVSPPDAAATARPRRRPPLAAVAAVAAAAAMQADAASACGRGAVAAPSTAQASAGQASTGHVPAGPASAGLASAGPASAGLAAIELAAANAAAPTGLASGAFAYRDAGGVAMAQLERDLVAMRAALPSGQTGPAWTAPAWTDAAPAGIARIAGRDAADDAAAVFAALDTRARRESEHRRLLGEALADALRSRAGRPLRVLELGEGHGEGVERALPALDRAGAPLEFVYADASPFRAALIAARFGADRPSLRSVVFDPRGIVADAAALRGRFDLILADTALDGGADPRPVLATAAGWLASDGELLLAERDDAPPRDWPALWAGAGLAPARAPAASACATVRLHRVRRADGAAPAPPPCEGLSTM